MKCIGRTLAVAALGASTLALATGVGTVAAGSPGSTVDCAFVGSTAARLQTPGVLQAGLGSQTIPAGAEILSIVVETYDDYDEIGFNSGNRDTANQTNERVSIRIGGVQVGGLTDDIPEVGPGGNVRAASVTTTVFKGSQVVQGGPVTVHHSGDTTTANSVQVRRVTITYRTTTCEGGYPVSLVNQVVSQTPVNNPPAQQPPAQQPPAQQPPAQQPPAQQPPAQQPAGQGASIPAPSNDQVVASNAVIVPAAGASTGSGTAAPTAGTSGAQVSSGTLTPPAAASLPASAAAPAQGGQGGSLPVTGSEPTNLVQLGFVAAAAGLGMIAVSGIRRRKATAKS